MFLFLHYYGLFPVRFSQWVNKDPWRVGLFHGAIFFYFPIAWWVTKELPGVV